MMILGFLMMTVVIGLPLVSIGVLVVLLLKKGKG